MTGSLEVFTALGSATLHEAQGKRGALSSSLKAIDPKSKLCGTALTVRTRPADNLALHRAVLEAKPGDVLVVDAYGYLEAGAWGDILTQAAIYRGISGLVINGAVRDVETIIELGFPVFAKGISIKGTNKSDPGSIGERIVIDSVEISRGDLVLGDRDGVVVVPHEEIDSALADAQERERLEADFLKQIKHGATTIDLYGF